MGDNPRLFPKINLGFMYGENEAAPYGVLLGVTLVPAPSVPISPRWSMDPPARGVMLTREEALEMARMIMQEFRA